MRTECSVRFPPPWVVSTRLRHGGREAVTVRTDRTIADVADGEPVPDDLTLTFGPPVDCTRTAVRAVAVAVASVLHEAMEWTRLGDPHPPGESYEWMAERCEALVDDYRRAFP